MSDTFDIDALAGMSDSDFLKQSQSAEESLIKESLNEDTQVEDTSPEEVEVETPENPDPSLGSSEDTSEEEEQEDPETEKEVEQEAKAEDGKSEAELQLAKLFAPFSANNTQIKVDTIDEAIDLMRMGANYHKKMHTIKPHLKFLKTLEKHNLLDEGKVNFLIDIMNKDVNAISKLLSDSGINPLDLKTEDVGYSPAKHTVSDTELNLEEVLESIKTTPTFKDTMRVITEEWDSSSKEYLTENPQRIADLNAHKANGLFDRINAEVAKQRLLGKLDLNLSDFEAYEKVGIQLMQAELAKKQTQPVVPNTTKPNATKHDKAKVATPKSKIAATTVSSIEELAKLSDAEFERLSAKFFK